VKNYIKIKSSNISYISCKPDYLQFLECKFNDTDSKAWKSVLLVFLQNQGKIANKQVNYHETMLACHFYL